MDKLEIQRFVEKEVTDGLLVHMRKAMKDVNAKGHTFSSLEGRPTAWSEPGSVEILFVNYVVSVMFDRGFNVESDPIVKSYLSMGESGRDPEAKMLNVMEGEISNGGFSQLYDNQGLAFIERCVPLLGRIKSKSTLRLAKRALQLLKQNKKLLSKYKTLQKKLLKLDSEFYELKESLPVLLDDHRKSKIKT